MNNTDIYASKGDVCSDLKYCLQRLVKGLSSNRKWARLGFSVALTQVLREFEVITVKMVMDDIEEHLLTTNHDSGKEIGAVYMGKAFGYMSLIQSGRLLQGGDGLVSEVVHKLLDISKKKSYLLPICSQGLAAIISKVSGKIFKDQIWPHLQTELCHGWKNCPPSIVMLTHLAATYHKKKVNKDFLMEHWGGGRLFSSKNYLNLIQVLMKSTENHPIVHSLADLVISDLFTSQEDVVKFFQQIIAPLLGGSYSHKYLGMHMYSTMLPHIADPELLAFTLSPTVMSEIVYHLPRKDSVVHPLCQRIVNHLVTQVGIGSKEMDVTILTCFTQSPSSINFDNVCNTHAVSKILHKVCDEAGKEYGQLVMDFIDGKNKKFGANTEKHAVGQFITLLTSPQLQDQEWRESVLQFLLARGFFTVNFADNSLPLCSAVPTRPNNVLRQCLKANFYKAINTLATLHHGHVNRVEQFQSYIDLMYNIMKYADKLIKSQESVSLHLESGLMQQVLENWEDIMEVMSHMDKKRKKEKSMSIHATFQLLFMYVGLSLFSEAEKVTDVMKDLSVCYEKACQKKKAKQEDEPSWIEVVTEVLVSLMSQRSNLTRVIANTVFASLQEHLSREALAIVLSTLQPNKPSNEEDDTLAFEDDEVEEMETDSVTDETTTDETNENEESEESDADEGDENDESDADVDDAMRETVKAALGKAAVTEDSDDSGEKSESDLSDSEMMKLDGKLAEVFRSLQKGKSKEEKEKRREIVLFKSRVLDLVETVVKGPLTATHALDLLELLLQLMNAGHRRKEETQLGERSTGIFKRLVKKQKEIKIEEDFEKTSAVVMLTNLIQYSRKVNSQDMVRAVSDACLVTIRLLIHQKLDAPSPRRTRSKSKSDTTSKEKDDDYLQHVQETVGSALSDFLYRRDHRLHMVFFHNMLQKHPMMFWPLTDILEASLRDTKVKVHSKTQACCLLSAVFMAGKGLVHDVSDDVWTSFSSQLVQTLNMLLLRLSSDSLKPKFTLELLNVVFRLAVIHPDSGKKVTTNEVVQKLEELKSHFNKDTRSVCNKVLNFARKNSGSTEKKQKKKKLKKQKNGDIAGTMSELALTNGGGGDNSQDLLSDSVTSTSSIDTGSSDKVVTSPVRETPSMDKISSVTSSVNSPRKRRLSEGQIKADSSKKKKKSEKKRKSMHL